MDQLNNMRNKIDEWDQLIIEAFEERMKTVADILTYKRQKGLAIYDTNREAVVIEKALRNLETPQFKEEAETLIKEIIKISRKMQSKLLFPFNIVLIGFMGTGKTTVGKGLLEKLDMDFVDLDQLIEIRIGRSISQYFKEEGEAAFRKVEKEVVKEISSRGNTIISCGGGVVLDLENIENLRKNGKIVLLSASESTIYNRVKKDATRPLLNNQMGIERISELLQQRRGLYSNAAHMVIDTEDQTPDEICKEIITVLLNTN